MKNLVDEWYENHIYGTRFFSLVKCANIILQQFGVNLLLTQGLTSVDKNVDEYSEPYVAPEVLKGSQPIQAADIYAFSVVMTEMSMGKKSFDEIRSDINLSMKI
ncbi:hypothetical protein C2G38_2185251 [Gigaspora rosea]|uniref:Protein kinase domain-containing protein n=1 Tax=Gigaspora rosea TaxID=44941 RepID=A0A397VE28_9GLOM|nr:hypothetical protein C2G38_2185251 [Gigaspora rosea]